MLHLLREGSGLEREREARGSVVLAMAAATLAVFFSPPFLFFHRRGRTSGGRRSSSASVSSPLLEVMAMVDSISGEQAWGVCVVLLALTLVMVTMKSSVDDDDC
nr:hypothetical protein Iba_chr07eCG6020 [Ipomoea batatas]GME10341.1 hypothetical protein Iba_scaffold9928CG0020 [Ipomoea batatas]